MNHTPEKPTIMSRCGKHHKPAFSYGEDGKKGVTIRSCQGENSLLFVNAYMLFLQEYCHKRICI